MLRLPAATQAPIARAQYGYAFAPGSESSIRLLASLLKGSVHIWHAPYGFTSAGVKFAHGAFLVRVAANRDDVHDVVKRRAVESGARVVAIPSAGVSDGTDLGSNSVVPVLAPRIALLGSSPVSGTTFGFAWSITFFCALDARAHDRVFVSAFWWFTFMAWPIAPLFHLLRTRGKKGALLYFLHALSVSFCAVTSGMIGTLVK